MLLAAEILTISAADACQTQAPNLSNAKVAFVDPRRRLCQVQASDFVTFEGPTCQKTSPLFGDESRDRAGRSQSLPFLRRSGQHAAHKSGDDITRHEDANGPAGCAEHLNNLGLTIIIACLLGEIRRFKDPQVLFTNPQIQTIPHS